MTFENTLEFAKKWIHKILYKIPARISFPEVNEKSDLFTGNSLGLQPKRTKG
jgi:hypothetical protein